MPLVTLLLFAAGAESPPACSADESKLPESKVAAARLHGDNGKPDELDGAPVSYTHLTLPTICSV